MLAYVWTFNVGFFNYYLSLGFGFFATALVWSGRGRELILVAPLAALALIAHPQGFIWLVGCVGYVVLWRMLPGMWKLAVPGAAVGVSPVPPQYFSGHFQRFGGWGLFGPGFFHASGPMAYVTTR